MYSEVGRGASFKVYFPVATVTGAPSEASPRKGPETLTGTETVLVVEDNGGLRELARRFLERHGYVVLLAASAEDALRIQEHTAKIDMLLTDVVMPGASGPELARKIIVKRPKLKVIYMSGYTEDSIVHLGVVDENVAFLQKPFNAEGLARKIRQVLDR